MAPPSAAAHVASAQYCGPWPVLPWSNITLASPSEAHAPRNFLENFPTSSKFSLLILMVVVLVTSDDTINVWYLAAPLMYCTVKDELTYLNGYHGGLGLENRNTGYSITFNYDAVPSFSEAVFPGITKYPNGSATLTWSPGGQTFTYLGINMTYWHCGSKVVATMTGSQYNSFIGWMKTVNDTYTEYNTLAVYKKFPNEPYLVGFECFQFVFSCIAQIQKMGGQLVDGVSQLHVAVANVYTDKPPTLVSFDDPKYQKDIVDYFEMLERMYNQLGVVKFIAQLFKLFVMGDCYVHYQDQYYHVDVNFPYFEQHWKEMPLLNPNASRYDRTMAALGRFKN